MRETRVALVAVAFVLASLLVPAVPGAAAPDPPPGEPVITPEAVDPSQTEDRLPLDLAVWIHTCCRSRY